MTKAPFFGNLFMKNKLAKKELLRFEAKAENLTEILDNGGM